MYIPDSGGESVLYILFKGDIKSCIERFQVSYAMGAQQEL
jgi:hypothetical protein